MPLYFEFMMTQTVINQDVKDTTVYIYLIIQMPGIICNEEINTF